MNNIFTPKKIDYKGTPYLVHAEVQGQGKVSNLRYGHAWIEDDENVYDFSNDRELIIPKVLYYSIGDVNINNPKKYQKYTFAEARRKMVQTRNYGCWDLDVEYKNGGEINYGSPKVNMSDIAFIHETTKEIAKKIQKNGFVIGKYPYNTNGVYVIPMPYKPKPFFDKKKNISFVELAIYLKPKSKIFWTNSKYPSDYYLGYGNKYYQNLYKKLNENYEFSIKNQNSYFGSEAQEKFNRNMEKWLSNNDYCGVQQGGEIVITDLSCIESIQQFERHNTDIRYKAGGEIQERKETYKKWKSLVNMSKTELEKFYNSQEGKDAGLSSSEASSQGISSGRESARWIMRMKDTPISEWTPSMWRWANKQISFISRMSGNKGPLYDEKGRKTRKHTSLLIWGHNPKKYELGGGIEDVNTNTIELLNYSVINDFQSGSSLDFYQDLIFVIGDDAKDVVVLYKDFTEAKRVNMFQSETTRIHKDVKYDLETSTIVNINGVNNLLILGSGAKQEFRSVGYLIPLNTKYVVPEPFRYNTFVSRLKREDGIKEINIEGCASLPNKFLLANRGNKRNPDNLLIVTENNFWENQENASISVCRMLLPDKDAAVSELNYDELTDTLFFTASIEQTTNAIDDGNIGDSFIGYIKNISQKLNKNTVQIDYFYNLSKISPKFEGHKIEGMCIENKSGNNYTINLVSDNDNDESTIFKIKLITAL